MAGGLPLGLIGGGLGAIGGLFSGLTGLFSGNAQAAQYRNAALSASMKAGVNAQEAITQGREATAMAAVKGAANGGGFTGSTTGLLQSMGDKAMFNARANIFTGRTEAQNDLYQAAVASDNAKLALIGGAVGAGGSLAGGFMQQSYLSDIAKADQYGGGY